MSTSGATHETPVRKDDVKVGSDRSFGLVFTAFCGIVAAVQWWIGSGRQWGWLGAAAAFAALSLVAPRALHPLNLLWFRFGMLLHRVMTPLILGLMFFTVFTPIGMVMRLFGRRPLSLERDPAATTYWVERKPPGPAPDSFNNQF
jgi:hypothetical protein